MNGTSTPAFPPAERGAARADGQRPALQPASAQRVENAREELDPVPRQDREPIAEALQRAAAPTLAKKLANSASSD